MLQHAWKDSKRSDSSRCNFHQEISTDDILRYRTLQRLQHALMKDSVQKGAGHVSREHQPDTLTL